jgi:16S rRNA processing protein RimM
VRGEVTIRCDDRERFAPGARFHTAAGDALVVATVKPYRDRGVIVGFSGVHDRAGAEALRGAELSQRRTDRPALLDGEFWLEDLIGLTAVDTSGVALGTVTAVEVGGQDRLVVTVASGEEVLVPFVDDLVGDPDEGRIVIDPPPGLFPGEA